MNPKITVVTVCYNSQDTIEDTINSVINQTYHDIEYIIVDGASDDNSWDIAQAYISQYPYMKGISESDSGLYNAMNKAVALAIGEYIIFMNSGDKFYSNDSLQTMSSHLQGDMVFGNVVRNFGDRTVTETYAGKHIVMKLLLQGKMMSHQAMFVKTSIMKRYGFDETYRITADYDLVVRLQHDRREIKYVNQIISIVDNVLGISSASENIRTMREEDDRSLRKHFPGYYYALLPAKSLVRLLVDRF